VACYATAARQRGDREEALLFAALTIFGVAAQAVFLAAPPDFRIHAWTISEFRGLLLAAGLAVFAREVTTRLVARYGTAGAPYGAIPA
jgi:hypothetical protein